MQTLSIKRGIALVAVCMEVTAAFSKRGLYDAEDKSHDNTAGSAAVDRVVLGRSDTGKAGKHTDAQEYGNL